MQQKTDRSSSGLNFLSKDQHDPLNVLSAICFVTEWIFPSGPLGHCYL